MLLPDVYDDGGLSGGSLARPALQRLIADLREGRVDRIVVYKIDRLTRSLSDFSKIVDALDAVGASFVSVTQSFNTATSMGRLTLNMLLSFAQFEREVTAERIRDKIAASKRKGLWMGGQVPLGYDADGRTPKINAAEAVTVRTLYALYERLGTVRAVKAEADRQGLRTGRRETKDGRVRGDGTLARGHLYQILTNPLYAGRIRDRGQVHDGQQPAIVAPGRWEAVQAQMEDGAARGRGAAAAPGRSPLAGRLRDETVDRLTPTHAKTRAGTRRRYYVSHRLIARSGEGPPDGWRLPAAELESCVAELVGDVLAVPGFAAALRPDASAAQIGEAARVLQAVATTTDQTERLALVGRIDIAPGRLTLMLDPPAIAARLGTDPDGLDPDCLASEHLFRLRKRGVETKLILAGAPGARDDILIRNIARAHNWLERIKRGDIYKQIATDEGISTSRIQKTVDLACLAPDLVTDILDGKQPLGFTTEWCKTHDLPSDWDQQRALLRAL